MTTQEAVIRSFFMSRLERHPRSPAVQDFDRKESYTFGDLARRANGLANVLVKECGVRKGDRVAICAPNDMVYLDLFYATPRTGAISTAYNVMLDQAELATLIQKETPKVLFSPPTNKIELPP